MKPLAVIQPGYNGVETIALLDCQTIRKEFHVPLHVGTVEYMQGVFDRLGVDVKPLEYPESLIPFYNRYAQEIVVFDQEYRVYCIGDKIVGHGRYDSNDSDDLDIVEVYQFCEQVMKAWTAKPAAYAIDVGRIVDRGLSIVELTDAWAIGLYKPMSFEMYSKMLQVRWNQIMEGV
jgi:hypothetical protein